MQRIKRGRVIQLLVVFDVDRTLSHTTVKEDDCGASNFRLQTEFLALVSKLRERDPQIQFAVSSNNANRGDCIIKFLNEYFGGEEGRRMIIPDNNIICGNGMDLLKVGSLDQLNEMLGRAHLRKYYTVLVDDSARQLASAAEEGYSTVWACDSGTVNQCFDELLKGARAYQDKTATQFKTSQCTLYFKPPTAAEMMPEAIRLRRKKEREAERVRCFTMRQQLHASWKGKAEGARPAGAGDSQKSAAGVNFYAGVQSSERQSEDSSRRVDEEEAVNGSSSLLLLTNFCAKLTANNTTVSGVQGQEPATKKVRIDNSNTTNENDRTTGLNM